jgi:hypothetical protein
VSWSTEDPMINEIWVSEGSFACILRVLSPRPEREKLRSGRQPLNISLNYCIGPPT